MSEPLYVVLRCSEELLPKVRYVFDTLLMARGVPIIYSAQPPSAGLWLLYGPVKESPLRLDQCLAIAHHPHCWQFLEGRTDFTIAANVDGLAAVLPEKVAGFESPVDIPFDIAANAFYFLSSWSERVGSGGVRTRKLFSNSIFTRLGLPQNIVDQYLERVMQRLNILRERLGLARWASPKWPHGATYALVLSHDIDFIPSNFMDTAKQGLKTILRHLVLERDPVDAAYAAAGFVRAIIRGRDPYGCVPDIIEREKGLGVRASFQVAVGRRHQSDVNYRIEDNRIRDYLRVIPDSGLDLCLHGSYRSTENPAWYLEEVALLTERLGKPLGSRQHFLSFDYDALFAAQERAGIQYDMSMGFPDHAGPRAGFSHPYFPFCLRENRPYNVLQISLFLMDVTLRSYMGLTIARAREAVETVLNDLCSTRGCVSAVWHPIVFGAARDPGYDRLFWYMVERVRATGGLATDGRTINDFWRGLARNYRSFI